MNTILKINIKYLIATVHFISILMIIIIFILFLLFIASFFLEKSFITNNISDKTMRYKCIKLTSLNDTLQILENIYNNNAIVSSKVNEAPYHFNNYYDSIAWVENSYLTDTKVPQKDKGRIILKKMFYIKNNCIYSFGDNGFIIDNTLFLKYPFKYLDNFIKKEEIFLLYEDELLRDVKHNKGGALSDLLVYLYKHWPYYIVLIILMTPTSLFIYFQTKISYDYHKEK